MKTFKEAKQAYTRDHLSKDLAQPERRLNALAAIEKVIANKSPNLLNNDNLFKLFDKDKFEQQYKIWKGSALSSAEKSVIVGLFKFSR